MDRYYAAQMIKHVGGEFGRVMACLHSKDYVAGYNQAVKDMAKMFEYESAVEEKTKAKKVVLFGGTKGRKL